MSRSEWHIGIVGTFDVANYGDLLFPLIAEAELAERLGAVRLSRFSYRAKPAGAWPFEVTSVSELPSIAPTLDAILVGGGFLVRFDKEVAPGYLPPTAAIHHPTGYWLSPALIALQHGVPLVWNAPGMHRNDIPSWAEPLVHLALSLSSYVAVRDEPTREALARFAGRDRIELVPDTAFGIARRLDGQPSFELGRVRDAAGLAGPYVIVQASVLGTFQRFLERHGGLPADLQVLVLPIGPDVGDDEALSHPVDEPGLVRLPVWPQPPLLAELVHEAAGVVGHSFHLAVTALAFGVPVFTLQELPAGKYTALAAFETIHLTDERAAEPGWFVSRLGRAAPPAPVAAALDRLAVHWDHVAEVVRAGRTATPPEMGRFWQSLPGLLEGLAARGEAAAARARLAREPEIAALEAARAEGGKRIDELTRLLALARAEIAARDRRIAALLASTSWKLTAPVRAIGRRVSSIRRGASGR